jgi:hypothetical protein
MNQLHVLLMMPAVFALWMSGAIGLMLLASAANLPGVNEHGTGAGFALLALAVGLIGAVVHMVVNLIQRKKVVDAQTKHGAVATVLMGLCGVAAVGLGIAALVMVVGSKGGDSTALVIASILAVVMIFGGFILFFTGFLSSRA